ncbi:hypothetical protein DW701_15020 [Bacteroides eggerthii]|jgi:hypothetical protein|uniref:Transmembrane protein n=1 Tax=Bacteroides eggerthii TaxID=28111 RepID=A0A414M5A4_9BACE|nr:hypothetical protein [Bacteroides eggerthii]MBT9882797.1 hypothetical protein [Bacteroides eggerthii]QUT46529.1 hypothetical protein INE88_03360 [Bacteroides eggerthii]RHF04685.1 hypothetical protein DW701_15020 [Bacteroides eggerthii]RHH23748.1 hypothetical protein DW218_07205 [Bacteroides eggerthii]
MFDFYNYNFSSLISILAALLGVAFPLILQCIQKVDEQYGSTRLSAHFKREPAYHCYFFLLVIGVCSSVLMPFLMFWLKAKATLVILETIHTLLVFSLSINFIYLFTIIQEYYDPEKLFQRIKNKSIKKQNYIERAWMGITDIAGYASRGDNGDICLKYKSLLIEEITAYWKNNSTNNYRNYPDFYLKIFERILKFSTDIRNRFFYNDNLLTTIIYNPFDENNYISPESYKILWTGLNNAIEGNNKEWVMQYWSNAERYYRFFIDSHKYQSDKESSEKQEEENEKQFMEMQIMVGGLLCYFRKYEMLNNIVSFSNVFTGIPRYYLVPGTFKQIWHYVLHFNELINSPNTLTDKYSPKGIYNDVNTDNFIYSQVRYYLVFLIIRLWSVNDYNYTFSDPMELPEIGYKDLNDLENEIWLIKSLKQDVDKWYENNTIEQVHLPMLPPKKEVMKLLDTHINNCKDTKHEIENSPKIDEEKVKSLKENLIKENKYQKLYLPSTNDFKKEKTAVSHYQCLPISIEIPASTLAEKHEKGISNLPQTLISFVNGKINDFYSAIFRQHKAYRSYNIIYRDIFTALHLLDVNKTYVILSMGIYLQNFTMIYGRPEDLEIDKDGNMRYLGAQIINIQSNLNALIIIKQNDLPVIELCKDECNDNNEKDMAPISEGPYLYSNIDHLQIENKRILLKIHKPFKLYIPEGDLHYYQLNIHSSIYGEENLKKIIAINKENKA